MKPIPPTFQTLFADLHQRLTWAEVEPGSIYFQTKRSVRNAYVKRSIGAARVDQYLGPVSDPKTSTKIAAVEAANAERRERRRLVQILKSAGGLPGPTLAMGRILETIAAGGLFAPPNGLVLVGTTAFQAFAPLIGAIPEAQTLVTPGIALIELGVTNDSSTSIHAVLERGGIHMTPDGVAAPPARLTGGGLTIEFLARERKGNPDYVAAPGLGVSAQALPYFQYLVENPTEVAILHGPGVLVRVPSPERYAVHKLIVAHLRKKKEPAKQRKDLTQAEQIMEAFRLSGRASAMEDEIKEARGRGPKWRTAVDASIADIERGRPHCRSNAPARRIRE